MRQFHITTAIATFGQQTLAWRVPFLLHAPLSFSPRGLSCPAWSLDVHVPVPQQPPWRPVGSDLRRVCCTCDTSSTVDGRDANVVDTLAVVGGRRQTLLCVLPQDLGGSQSRSMVEISMGWVPQGRRGTVSSVFFARIWEGRNRDLWWRSRWEGSSACARRVGRRRRDAGGERVRQDPS